jgi:hypothetical protein
MMPQMIEANKKEMRQQAVFLFAAKAIKIQLRNGSIQVIIKDPSIS